MGKLSAMRWNGGFVERGERIKPIPLRYYSFRLSNIKLNVIMDFYLIVIIKVFYVNLAIAKK